MKKRVLSILRTVLSVICLFGLLSASASAYYNRGTVQIASLGSTSVTIEQGKSVSITVSLNPWSYTGNVGCGMAECPQVCGGMCGDEVTGQCECAGDEKRTAYTDLILTSSNASVATASYQNGVITINGIKSGTAELTLVASLWQHTNSAPKMVEITVTSPAASSSSGKFSSTSSAYSSVQDLPGDLVSAITPGDGTSSLTSALGSTSGFTGSTSSVKSSLVSGTSSGEKSFNTPMGAVQIVTLQDAGPIGKLLMQQAVQQNGRLTFQKLEPNGNILYSWTFEGKTITNPQDISMEIIQKDAPPSGFEKKVNLQKPYYLSFSHQGSLPGKAEIYLSVGSTYAKDDILALYYFNQEQGELQMVQKNLPLKAGYVSFSLEHCSDYVIALYQTNTTPVGLIIAVCSFVILLLAFAIWFVLGSKIRRKKMLQLP